MHSIQYRPAWFEPDACPGNSQAVLRQPTAQHVNQLAETHRNALEILKKIGDCCIKEAQGWASNVQALAKAKSDEAKALAKEKLKEQRRDEASKKREAARKEKAEAAAKAKAEKDADQADGQGNQPIKGDEKKSRNRTRTGQAEITEEDPDLLLGMQSFSMGAMACLEDVKAFVAQISEVPSAACIARLKRGPFKKVLAESWLA